eukprot:57004-Pelagomonas_calceolata.AAC.4
MCLSVQEEVDIDQEVHGDMAHGGMFHKDHEADIFPCNNGVVAEPHVHGLELYQPHDTWVAKPGSMVQDKHLILC